MTVRRYVVDWEDEAFPQIRRSVEPVPAWETPVTFAKAKAEIIEHCQRELEHARFLIKQTRALRVKDVD